MTKPRDYRHEYDAYQGKPEQIKNRAQRNAARAQMKKKIGASAISGKDIDHKKMIRSGGGNDPGNLKVSTVRANRNWRLGKG